MYVCIYIYIYIHTHTYIHILFVPRGVAAARLGHHAERAAEAHELGYRGQGRNIVY